MVQRRRCDGWMLRRGALDLHAALLTGLLALLAPPARGETTPSPAAQTAATTPEPSGPSGSPISPTSTTPPIVDTSAPELRDAISGAAEDLGANAADVRVFPRGVDLIAEASKIGRSDHWRLFAELDGSDTAPHLTVLGVAPSSDVLLLRSEPIPKGMLEVRAVAMIRDVVRSVESVRAAPAPPAQPPCGGNATPVRSPGRATLALHAALIGAYLGYSIERAGGSSDARLTYPLMALGTGLGIGAAMVIADEWDVGYGDAWFLSAGALWPTTSALLLADGYDVSPTSSHFVVGLAGTAGGLALASFALSQGHMSDGAATLAHSGGAFGLLLGGIGQMAIAGKTEPTPIRGMGYGAAGGVLLAGTAATLGFAPSPSRVLLADLGAGLGGLTSAAAASPLAIGGTSPAQKRIWLTSIAAGSVAGAVIGYLIAGPDAEHVSDDTSPRLLPYAQVVPKSGQHGATGISIGVQGAW